MSNKNFDSFMNNDENDDDLVEEPKKNYLVLLSIAIAFVALSGAAWYVYDLYQEKNDHEMLLITADNEEIKAEPAEPGGMVVDNMDKSVYEAIEKPSHEAKAERVLLPSEEPVDRSSIAATAAEAAPDEEEKKQELVAEVDLQASASPALLPTIEIAPIPEFKAEVEKPAPTKPTNQPVKKIYKVQIASFKTKQDAEKDWNLIVKKHSNVLKGYSHYVVTKEIAGKGTFYRLQIGPFDNGNSARSACNNLQKNGLNCFVVKP